MKGVVGLVCAYAVGIMADIFVRTLGRSGVVNACTLAASLKTAKGVTNAFGDFWPSSVGGGLQLKLVRQRNR